MPGPYELYLIRHAVAEERGDEWPDDAKRPLSDDGASRMRKAARGLDRLGVTLDVVVTSALVRAKQTAELVAGAMNPRPPIVTADSLAPDGNYRKSSPTWRSRQADADCHRRPRAGDRGVRGAAHRIASFDRVQEGAVCGSTSTPCRQAVPAICGGC
jgi:hypothetical protein